MSLKRKGYAVSLAVILGSTSLLTACGSDDKKADPSPAASTAADASTAPESKYSAPFENGKYNPPITMTTVRVQGGDIKFKNGETMEDNVHTRWAKEKLGIDIKTLYTVANNEALSTKLRLALASNEEMPDVIPLRDDAIAAELIDSGKFMEVGDLFEKFAGEAWKEAVKDFPSVWYPFSKDGKKIGVPITDYAYNEDEVLWIREDWLKKLNLTAPTTLEEFEKVLDAFTNQDPDGNGKKDTYGLTYGAKNKYNTWMSGVSSIFGSFGAMPDNWYEKDGKLVYGSVQPEIKQGLETLRNWMAKGYVPKDAGLFDEIKASDLFVSGQAGIILGPHWMPAWPLNGLDTNVKGSEFKAYPVPVGKDGKTMRHGTKVFNGVVLINKNFKHPEAFFEYYNYMYENYANPKPGSEWEHGMAEGYDWANVDGVPTTDASKIKDHVDVYKYTLTFEGARIPSLEMKTLEALANGKAPETAYEKRDAAKDPRWIHAGGVVMKQAQFSYPEMFVGQPTPTYKDKWNFLRKEETETFAKIIYGELPMDAFDSFVEKWKSSGGDKVVSEVNEWYSSVK